MDYIIPKTYNLLNSMAEQTFLLMPKSFPVQLYFFVCFFHRLQTERSKVIFNRVSLTQESGNVNIEEIAEHKLNKDAFLSEIAFNSNVTRAYFTCLEHCCT